MNRRTIGRAFSARNRNDSFYLRQHQQAVGDPEHIEVFANPDAGETWFAENDPEGVAFEYEVQE